MCLILFAVRPTHDYQLVLAANRDEFYERPTQQADWWTDYAFILGGRDLKMGGTWLGVTRSGRLAAVTNFREPPPDPVPPRSRGELTTDFLTSTEACVEYLRRIDRVADEYRGFNLVIGDGVDYYYYSNRKRDMVELKPGFYGLSNQLLNCDWPKTIDGRNDLASLCSQAFTTSDLFELLFAQGNDAPFSANFLASAEYGTCASSVVTISTTGEIYFEERNFRPHGVPDAIHSFNFSTDATTY